MTDEMIVVLNRIAAALESRSEQFCVKGGHEFQQLTLDGQIAAYDENGLRTRVAAFLFCALCGEVRQVNFIVRQGEGVRWISETIESDFVS